MALTKLRKLDEEVQGLKVYYGSVTTVPPSDYTPPTIIAAHRDYNPLK